ncbi:hypothetical protein ABB37_02582 [Leptomonas pyrrhocoris]|uniref:Secreted protein n=1 Tax=Leptomonas pyrrhocoris TaxID=157538 RepID=A0A0N0DXB9_LEPPY|nr:hypothetical protein ABB37_02582 [Leptomonas pyrrhocoris]KPA82805.1 hypothetical protein ABB37_02582 [Leptomonas pyrrhocoris]|eukprot:XP_015661244.1 hypothetical protein ABB37_02582 [Leptomonas pyrrhocoris]
MTFMWALAAWQLLASFFVVFRDLHVPPPPRRELQPQQLPIEISVSARHRCLCGSCRRSHLSRTSTVDGDPMAIEPAIHSQAFVLARPMTQQAGKRGE